MLHCTWMVCWIANETCFFRANCFLTDWVISNWNRCSHIHWPIYLLHWNMDQKTEICSCIKCRIRLNIDSKQIFNELCGIYGPQTISMPDLSPCDFFLFPRLKKMLSGNKYTSRSSLGSAIYQCLQQIPKEDYLSAFCNWVKRLQKCVSVKGEYFEGL